VLYSVPSPPRAARGCEKQNKNKNKNKNKNVANRKGAKRQ
jgi:hypothetical protein